MRQLFRDEWQLDEAQEAALQALVVARAQDPAVLRGFNDAMGIDPPLSLDNAFTRDPNAVWKLKHKRRLSSYVMPSHFYYEEMYSGTAKQRQAQRVAEFIEREYSQDRPWDDFVEFIYKTAVEMQP